jgi:hypothetical protein
MWGSMSLMIVSVVVITVLHCRGCTCFPWVVIILEKLNTHCTDEHPYTLPRCVLGNHYKTIQWFYLACNVPTEVSPLVWALHPPRIPVLCLLGSSHHSYTHTTPQFTIIASPNIPAVLPSQLRAQLVGTPRLDSTTYYAKPYPYRLMVVMFSWVVAPWTGT